MPYPVAPDPIDALINFLKADAFVSAITDTRVSTTKIDTPLPRIQLTMISGLLTEPYEEATEFQVDCWGGTGGTGEREAKTLARTVCTRIDAMRGPLAGGAVTTAVTTVRPFDLPDPITGRPRCVCQVAVTISPNFP